MPKARRAKQRTAPQQMTRAAFVPASVNTDERTVDIIWSTGAEGERCEWDGEVWLESLRVDAASVRMGRLNSGAPVLNTHRSECLDDQIGVVERAWLADGVGYATVRFAATPDAEPYWIKVSTGIVRNISVGYVVYKYEVIESATDGDPKRMVAIDWEPMELSFVPVPFDTGAQVRGGASPRTFTAEVIIRTKGIAPMTLKQLRAAVKAARAKQVVARKALVKAREIADETQIEEAQGILETIEAELEEALDALDEGLGDVPAEPAEPAEPVVPGAAENEEVIEERGRVAERNRQSRIRGLATRFPSVAPDAIEGLISRGLTFEQAQLTVLTTLAERQIVIGTQGGGNLPDNSKEREAMAAAILHRAAPGKHKATDAIRIYRGFSLFDMARRSIEMAGGRVEGLSRREIACLALNIGDSGIRRSAGMNSTSDFPQILGNTINRSLRNAYEETAPTWQPLGRQANVSDFRARTTVALGDAAALEKVLEGGEYKYGTLPEEGSTLKVDKYGKIIPFTWEALINDDLNAFDRLPTALANAARQTESNLVWSLLLSNPTWIDNLPIYSSAHGNLAASGGPINIETLGAARAAMRKQKGLGGQNFINITPRFLVVGPDKELEAYQYTSVNYTPTTNGEINPVSNTSLTVIVEPRIEGDAWYLVGDGADTFEYAYLEGEGGLFTETREGFDVDGIEVKARLVFGVNFVDFRSLYKNPGA